MPRRAQNQAPAVVRSMLDAAASDGPERACRAAATAVGDILGLRLPERWRAPVPRPLRSAVTGLPEAELRDPARTLGLGLEAILQSQRSGGSHQRKRTGAYFTPAPLVGYVLDTALEPALGSRPPRVLDPACGSGVFLASALRRMRARGTAAGALPACLFGWDINPAAVMLARFAVWLECDGEADPALLERQIRVGDALLELGERGACFEVIVGNPPFLNQLQTTTAHDRGRAARLRALYGDSARCYADAASIFLELAARVAAPGGRIALVQPQSLLAARDARPVRETIARRGTLTHLWIAQEQVFSAGVLVCIPTVHMEARAPRPVRIAAGASFTRLPDAPAQRVTPRSWAPLVAAAHGVPDFELDPAGTIGDHAAATADFRDQFYGLRGRILEDSDLPASADATAYPPLITTGLVDPASCAWGQVPARIDGRRWLAPRLDLQALSADPELARWARLRLIPKLLLATQTRTLEVAADERGEWVPVTPLITVAPRKRGTLWHLGAALNSPVLTAWAVREHAGAGLTASAIKLSARQVASLPAPREGPAWDDAAGIFREAASEHLSARRHDLLVLSAARSCEAFGLDQPTAQAVMEWWAARLSKRRPRPSDLCSLPQAPRNTGAQPS